MKNYRPISNLSFMSKVVERIVVRQLSEYFTANSLLPKFQSGFRRHHSTESALLRVLSEIFSATDKGRFRFWPCSTLVLHLTLWIIRSCWTGWPFRMEYRVLRSGASTGGNLSSSVVHRRFIMVVWSQGVLSCDLELPRDQYWARSCISSTQQMSRSRNVWNRSVSDSISMPTTPIQFHDSCKSTYAAELAARAICASSGLWETGCHRTGSD